MKSALPCHRLPIGRCQSASFMAGSGTQTRVAPSPASGSTRVVTSKRRQPVVGVGANSVAPLAAAGVAAAGRRAGLARANAGSARLAASAPLRMKLRRFTWISRSTKPPRCGMPPGLKGGRRPGEGGGGGGLGPPEGQPIRTADTKDRRFVRRALSVNRRGGEGGGHINDSLRGLAAAVAAQAVGQGNDARLPPQKTAVGNPGRSRVGSGGVAAYNGGPWSSARSGSAHACPVCLGGRAAPLHACWDGRDYWRCDTCEATFVPPAQRPTVADERAEYLLHRNDADDPAYLRFLSRLAAPLLQRLPPGAEGLDHGLRSPGRRSATMICAAGHRSPLRSTPLLRARHHRARAHLRLHHLHRGRRTFHDHGGRVRALRRPVAPGRLSA